MGHRSIVVMNFSQVYDNETFYEQKDVEWIDCTDVQGTNCYCDENACRLLIEKINKFTPNGIHFIDSGNYHYMSKLWTDKIKIPFNLIIFDHHPDMQPPLFDNFISCGCWVKNVLDLNPFLKKVIILGISDSYLEKVSGKYMGKMICYGESQLKNDQTWQKIAQEHISGPVYISIDKDVLNEESAATNWDQGSMSLNQMKVLLNMIFQNHEVIGVDICGECSPTCIISKDNRNNNLNDRTNRELLEMISLLKTN